MKEVKISKHYLQNNTSNHQLVVGQCNHNIVTYMKLGSKQLGILAQVGSELPLIRIMRLVVDSRRHET